MYGNDDVGTEHDESYTVRKVIIENGKVISATGEFPYDIIADLGESSNNKGGTTELGNTNNQTTTNNILGGTTTEKNDNKLPKTGEETNAFADYLLTVIVLGVVWLGSMLLIDREKKKMTKR